MALQAHVQLQPIPRLPVQPLADPPGEIKQQLPETCCANRRMQCCRSGGPLVWRAAARSRVPLTSICSNLSCQVSLRDALPRWLGGFFEAELKHRRVQALTDARCRRQARPAELPSGCTHVPQSLAAGSSIWPCCMCLSRQLPLAPSMPTHRCQQLLHLLPKSPLLRLLAQPWTGGQANGLVGSAWAEQQAAGGRMHDAGAVHRCEYTCIWSWGSALWLMPCHAHTAMPCHATPLVPALRSPGRRHILCAGGQR